MVIVAANKFAMNKYMLYCLDSTFLLSRNILASFEKDGMAVTTLKSSQCASCTTMLSFNTW